MTVNWTEIHGDLNDISCKIIQLNGEEIQISLK